MVSTERKDSSNGGNASQVDAVSPPPCQTDDGAKPNRVIGRPFRSGDGRKRGPQSFAELRRVHTRFIVKQVTREDWRRMTRNLVEIASDPKNRQAVAAFNTLADRCLGAVAQAMQLDVTSGGESLEDRRQRILARLAELGMSAPGVLPAISTLAVADAPCVVPDAQTLGNAGRWPTSSGSTPGRAWVAKAVTSLCLPATIAANEC